MMQSLIGWKPSTGSEVAPRPEAEETARIMLSDRDVQRTVLLESAQTHEESGRSFCAPGESVAEEHQDAHTTPRGNSEEMVVETPLQRAAKKIELAACPLGGGGLLHTHPTSPQAFRDPILSLPDMMHVLLEDGPATSMVLGSNTSEVMMEPKDKGFVLRAFSDLLHAGGTVQTPGEVDQLRRELSQAELLRVHKTMRSRFRGLFKRVPTGHNIRLSTPATASTTRALANSTRPAETLAHTAHAGLSGHAITFDPSKVDINLAQVLTKQVVDATITGIVLAAFVILLGGTPPQLVQNWVRT